MNTPDGKWKRIYRRAPLRGHILYIDGDYVFKANTLNIGEGGIGLESFPKIPGTTSIPLMFSLVQYPPLSDPIKNRVDGEYLDFLSSQIIRARSSLVRTLSRAPEAEEVFMTKFALQFVSLEENSKKAIQNYVSNMSHNIRYLLGLFERSDPDAENIARFLGYLIEDDPNLIRAAVLHDYQSLESL